MGLLIFPTFNKKSHLSLTAKYESGTSYANWSPHFEFKTPLFLMLGILSRGLDELWSNGVLKMEYPT